MSIEDRPKVKKIEKVMKLDGVRFVIPAVIGCLCIKYSDHVIEIAKLLLYTMRPLFYGVAIAYVLNIFMKKLEQFYFPKRQDRWVMRTRRPICVFGSVILVLVLLIVLVLLVVPSLADAMQVMTKDIPKAFGQFQAWLSQLLSDTPELQQYVNSLNIDWNGMFGKIGNVLSKGIGNLFNSAFSVANVIFSFLFTGLISVIFAIYMLFGKERLQDQMRKLAYVYAPRKQADTVGRFLTLANDTFTNYAIGQMTEAILLGTLCGVGMTLLRMPYALMTGVIVGATALIPVMGAYIGAFVGTVMILTVEPLKALEFLIYIAILQQIEGNLIYPRVVGSSIGLPGIWVLAAVTIGGGLFGIPGMLIGVPLTATLYKWIREDVNKKLDEERVVKPEKP